MGRRLGPLAKLANSVWQQAQSFRSGERLFRETTVAAEVPMIQTAQVGIGIAGREGAEPRSPICAILIEIPGFS